MTVSNAIRCLILAACCTTHALARDFAAPFEEKPDYVPGERAPLVQGIDSVMLRVPDPAQTGQFFREATAFDWVSGALPEGVHASLHAPNVTLHLASSGTPHSGGTVHAVNSAGISHLCFQSYEQNPGYPRFSQAGATDLSVDPPVDLGGYGVTYAYLQTPAGLMIEAEQLDFSKLAHETPRDAALWLSHVAIVTDDIVAMLEFYEKLLGIAAFRQGRFGPSPTMDRVAGLKDVRTYGAWFNVGNLHIELWQYVTPETLPQAAEQPARYDLISFEVENLDATLERLSALNIATSPVLTQTVGRSVTLSDPGGNRLRLIEFPVDGRHLSVRHLDYHTADFRVVN